MVAFRDGRCDNDDATFDSLPLLYIGGCVSVKVRDMVLRNIGWWGEHSGSRDVAHCSRGRSCLVAFRDGRRDNDGATFNILPLLYIGGNVTVIGEAGVAACRLSFERAQLLPRTMR